MRILVLTSVVPYPPHGGGHARMYAMLRHLSREHTLDLISLARPSEMVHRQALQRLCRQVIFLPAPPPRAGLTRWMAALKNLVLLRAYEADPEIHRAITARLATSYDLIQVENGFMIPYVASARTVPRILDTFGLWSGGLWRDLAARAGVIAKLQAVVGWLKAKRVERRLARIFDAVYVVSEADRAYLSAVDPRLKIRVVSNGVDTEHFVPAREPAPPPVRLVFTGAMDYTPNEDAMLFFHREIYPRIVARLPEVRLWIVGRDPGPRLAALAHDPSITLTGAVADVRPYLAQGTVVVVPMRLGSGTRIKVLEALAMGKAVVSTRVGTEGLRVIAGKHFVRADDSDTFATEVARLAGDATERQRLGREGRALVEAEYDWRVVLAPLSRVLEEMAGRELSGTCTR